jgi:EAL domain-containing protein (putative c-di-GMP-specific phosphodiesterase class I)
VANLGDSLGMAITAEGVESREQLEVLQRAGCTELQGYFFGRPMPAEAVMTVLRDLAHSDSGR